MGKALGLGASFPASILGGHVGTTYVAWSSAVGPYRGWRSRPSASLACGFAGTLRRGNEARHPETPREGWMLPRATQPADGHLPAPAWSWPGRWRGSW